MTGEETKHAACVRMLGEIRRVCEGATKRPWRFVSMLGLIEPGVGALYPFERAANGEFIARSRSWLPAFVEHAEGILTRHRPTYIQGEHVDPRPMCGRCPVWTALEDCHEVAALHAALLKMVEG